MATVLKPRRRAGRRRVARFRRPARGNHASTSASSSSATTRRTKATARSSRARPSARSASGRSSRPLLAKEREKGILDVSQVPSSILAHDPGYIDKDNEIIVGLQTDAPLEARDHAVRRLARGRDEPRGLRLQAGRARRRDLHQVPQDAQRRRVRRLHAGDPQGALVGHRHRPARRLRPRPHHRRLPPRGALRRRFPDRRQEAREAASSTTGIRPRTSSGCARSSPSRSARWKS